jgi:hypothetical protein
MEGTGKVIGQMLKQEIKKSFISKIGALLMRKSLKNFKKRMDSKEIGGAMILGLPIPVVKAHGNSDAYAFKNAIGQARIMVENKVVENKATENQVVENKIAGNKATDNKVAENKTVENNQPVPAPDYNEALSFEDTPDDYDDDDSDEIAVNNAPRQVVTMNLDATDDDNTKVAYLKEVIADLRHELFLWRNGTINVQTFNATLHTHGLKYNPDNNEIEEFDTI